MTKTPLWRAIADELRAEIGAGHYRPGDRLPTEAQLAARFGVNRHTVRAALAALAQDGVLHSRRGAGVFVTAQPVDYPLGRRVRFHTNLALAGRLAGRRIGAITPRAADRVEAMALGLQPGAAVVACEGVSTSDGRPVAVFRSVFPADRLPALPDILRQEAMRDAPSITHALTRAGVPDYLRAETRISATIASAAQAALLELAQGAPLITSEAINRTPEGWVVERGLTWFAAERVTLTLGPQ